MKTQFTCFLVLIIYPFSYHAQKNNIPSVVNDIGKHNIPTYRTEPVNNQKLIDDYKYDETIFGVPVEVNINILEEGVKEVLMNKKEIIRYKLISDNSLHSYIIFDEFYLPKGCELYAYNDDYSNVYGPFDYKNNRESQTFSIGPFYGESVTIELSKTGESYAKSINPKLNISSFIHSFKSFNSFSSYRTHEDLNSSRPCHNNVMCNDPQIQNYCNERRSVAMMVRIDDNHPAGFCTGTLVNNSRRDNRPYFLTAHHCGGCLETGENVDWLFLFNYQSEDCDNPSIPPDFEVISGATIRFHHVNTDLNLLELHERPTHVTNAFYSGWNRVYENPEFGASIHHPSGDIKKISLFDGTETPFSTPNITCGGSFQQDDLIFVRFDFGGAVEPGSSGSSLFNQQNRTVGILALQPDEEPCIGRRAVYGMLTKAWDSSPVLGMFLAPNNLAITSISGINDCRNNYLFENANDLHTSINVNLDTGTIPGSRSYDGVYRASGTIETGDNVTIQNSTSVEFRAEKVILNPGFTAEAGSHFIAAADPCPGGCVAGAGMIQNDDIPDVEYNYERAYSDENSSNTPTGIDEHSHKKHLSIHPNPSPGLFNINIQSKEQLQINIEVYDMAGRQVYSKHNARLQEEVDLSGAKAGIYFIRIQASDEIFTEKLVVQ